MNNQDGWEDLLGFPGYIIHRDQIVKNKFNGKTISTRLSERGYVIVSLYIKNKGYVRKMHRLMAIQWIPNPENKPQVNHIDGDKLNNALDNLEWSTGKENMEHAFRTGLKKKFPLNQYSREGVLIKSWDSLYEAARFLNINCGGISQCISGKKKTYKGFVWMSSCTLPLTSC